MQTGFATDRTLAAIRPSGWVEGEPTKTFWVGTTLTDRALLPMVAFRCAACAFVEMYAPDTGPR